LVTRLHSLARTILGRHSYGDHVVDIAIGIGQGRLIDGVAPLSIDDELVAMNADRELERTSEHDARVLVDALHSVALDPWLLGEAAEQIHNRASFSPFEHGGNLGMCMGDRTTTSTEFLGARGCR